MEEGAKAPEIVPPSCLEPFRPAQMRYNDNKPLQPQGQKPTIFFHNSGFHRGLLLGLLCATIIVSAALGGGLGATLSSCKSKLGALETYSPTTTSSPNSTTTISTIPTATSTALLDNYQATLPSQINTLHSDCDPSNTPTNLWGATFTPICGRDIITGSQSVEGGVITDILGMTAYSFMDCMNACSGYNWGAKNAGSAVRCRAIVFGTDMKNETGLFFGNCWLKNGTLANKLQGLAKEVAMGALWVRGGPM